METIRASSKGQIVIPKAIRDSLDIRSGTELDVELIPGEGFKVTRRDADHVERVGKLAGSLAAHGKKPGYARLSDTEVVALVVREDDSRIKAYSRTVPRTPKRGRR
jgi:AbrB family looped-hinge helix DNA binding protein